MRPLRTFALRNYITLIFCTVALIAFLGSGLTPASGSKDTSVHSNDKARALPGPLSGNDEVVKLESPVEARRNDRSEAFIRMLHPASFASPFAVGVTAVKTAVIQTDNNNIGKADPGDTLMYTVVITNNSGSAVTGVSLADMLEANLTLVPGSVVASPIAVNDAYNTIGNVNISVPAATGVLLNDLDPNGGSPAVVAPFPTTSTNGGAVSLNADGSFTYNPPAGFVGTDTFTYTAGNGTGKTDTGTVSITVTGRIWFVNSAAGVNGDGRLTSPFNILTGAGSADSVDASNDVIFLYTSGTNYTGGITLNGNEKIIGQGASQSILAITLFTAPSGANLLPATNNASDPVITTGGTDAITLASGNGLFGFTVGNTGAGADDISGTMFGMLTVNDVSLNGTGEALNLANGTIVSGSTFDKVESTSSSNQGIHLSQVGGGFTIATTNIVNPTGTGIDVQNSPGGTSFSFGSTIVNKGASAGTGVNLAFNNAAPTDQIFSFSGLTVTTMNGTGVDATSTGTVNVTTGSITSTGGPALVVDPTTVGMTFTSVSSTGSTGTGISLTSVTGSLTINTTSVMTSTDIGINVQSSNASANLNFGATTVNGTGAGKAGINLASNGGTISFGATSSVTSAGGTAFNVNAGNAAITYSGNITQNSAQRVVNVSSITGGSVSITGGTVTGGASSTGVNISSANGNVTFANLALGSSISRTANTAVTIANGTTGNTYDLGIVNIFTTGAGQGIVETNFDGTLNTTSGTVDSSGAQAVNVDGPAGLTTLGMTLTKVAASGGTNGIFIQDTNGSFTVTGNGSTANSGGTIQNTTGNAVTLTNASAVTLKFMHILQPGANNAGNVGACGVLATNLSGTNLVEKSTIEYGATAIPNSSSVRLVNTSTNSTLTLEATTIQNKQDGESAVSLSAKGNSQITFNVQDSNTGDAFDSKYTNLFPSGIVVGSGDDAGSTAKVFLNVSNTDFVNAPSNGFNDLEMTVQQSATLVPNISNNLFDKVGLPLAVVGVININAVGSGRLGDNSNNCLISGNTISNIRSGAGPTFAYDAAGVNGYFGIRIAPDNDVANINHKIKIENNVITELARTGLYVSARNLSNDVNVLVQGNTIGTQANAVGYANVRGIHVETEAPSASIKVQVLNNPSIVGRGSSNSNSSLHFRAGVENNAAGSIQATVVGNTIGNANPGSGNLGRFRAQTLGVADGLAGVTASICLDLRNNVLESAAKTFDLIHDSTGTFTLNNSGNTGTVTTTGTIGSVASCGLPTILSAPAHELVTASIGIPGDTVSDILPRPSDLTKLSQAELNWMVQAAISRFTQLDISPEDISRLQSMKFEVADLHGGKVTAVTEEGAKIDETAAGHGWFFDQSPLEDGEFEVPVQSTHYEALDLSPAYGRVDLLTVLMRELGRVYLQGKNRIPKKLKPLMQQPLSPSTRVVPVFNMPVHPAASVGAAPGQSSNGATGSAQSGETQSKEVAAADSPKSDSSPSALRPKPAVFNPATDRGATSDRLLKPAMMKLNGAKGASDYRVSSARRVAASTMAPFSGGFTKNLGTIPAGESVTVMFQATINTPVSPAGTTQVCNQGTVSFNEGPNVLTDNDSNAGNGINPTCVTLAQADLEIVSKADAPDPIGAGSDITYTISFKNNGPDNAINAKVTDTLPANTTFASVGSLPSGWSRADSLTDGQTGTVMFTKAAVPNGEMATFTIVVHVDLATPANTHIMNTASTISDTPDGVQGNNSKTSDTLVTSTADLSITKTNGVTTSIPGNQTTYTIVVTNNGPNQVMGATVTDSIPATLTGVTFTSTTTGTVTGNTASGSGNTINDTVNMSNGATITYTVTGTINPAATGTLTNTASVAVPAGVIDLVSANNMQTDTDTLTPQSNMSITKTDGVATKVPGTTVTYTIVVTNNGPSNVVGATVADTFPATITGVTFTSTTTGTVTGNTASGSTTINDTVSMSSGATITYTATGTINPSATVSLSNTATVTAASDPDTSNNSATDTDTLTPQSDLSITKTDGVTTKVPGSTVTYTIVVTNTGPSNVVGATVADTFPATIGTVNYTSTTTGTVTGNTASGSGTINDTVSMSAGATITYSASGTIDAAATGNLSNTATVSSASDGNTANNSATDTDTLTPQGDLSITKSDGAGSAVPGTPITYTIVVTNTGLSNVVGATVADTFPGTLLAVSYTSATTGTVTGNTSGSGNINDTVNMSPGATITYTVSATISPTASGSLSNTATVTAPATFTDTNSGNNSATDTDTLTAQGDLSITKTDGVTSKVPGTSVTYTIIVSNSGPSSAIGALVADTFPATITGVTYTSTTTGTVSGNTASGSNNIADTVTMGPGSSITYTVTGTISSAATGSLSNTASVTAPGGFIDANGGNNSQTDTDTLTPQGDLSITKDDGGVTSRAPGTMVTYTIVVTNAGPSDVVAATVADTFPGTITGVTYTSTTTGTVTGNTASGSGNISDTVSMSSGATITYTATGTISPAASGSLSNTATVTAPGTFTDTNPANNSATDTDTLALMSDLSITKTDGATTKVPGSIVIYNIVVTNNGPSTVTGATVADMFPGTLSGVTFTSTTTGTVTGNTASGAGNINDTVNMSVGATITYTAAGTISPAATGSLSNTATVASATDGNTANNSATDTDTLTPQGDLSITKTDGVASAVPGTSATYTIVVSYNGPSNVVGATVTDMFPAALTGVIYMSTTTGTVSGNTASGSGNISDTVNMSPGSTITYTAMGTINSGATGSLSNTATVTAPGGFTDTNGGNNSATDTDTLTPQGDLSITKTDGVTTKAPGSMVTYTIVVTNNGPSNVVGASVADAFPAIMTGVTYTSTATGTVSGNTASGSGNIADTVSMSAGATITYTATGTISVAATGSLSNTATVTAPGTFTDTTGSNNSATDTDTLVPQGDLSITKTDGVASKVPGTSVTYTIVVTNPGPSNVVGATVGDTFPATITGVTYTSTTTGTVSGNTASGSGNFADTVSMSAASTITYTATGTISVAATGSLSNTATVTAPGTFTDPNPANNSATDTDTLTAQNDLSITKTDGVASKVPGSSVTYTIVVTNSGPSNLVGGTVTDMFPATINGVSYTSTTTGTVTGNTASGSGNINDTVNMSVGATITYTATGTISSSATGTLSNTATVSSAGDPTPGNNSATDTDTLTPQGDLSITKADGVTSKIPGTTVTYAIVVTNSGPSNVVGATVADTFPAILTGVTYTSTTTGTVSGNTASGSGNISDTVNMSAGATITYTVMGTISSAATGSLSNTATVTAPGTFTDTNVGNNSATDTDTLTPQADLAVTKTDSPDPAVASQNLTYTITVTNNGPSDAQTVTLVDTLPPNTTLVSVTTPAGWTRTDSVPAGGTGTISFSKATVVSGAISVFTIVVKVDVNTPNNSTITNSATAASGTADNISGNNTGTATTTVIAQADLAVTKSDSPDPVCVNGNITYTVNLTNNGPGPGLNTTVTDAVPANTTLVSATTSSAGWSRTDSVPAGGTGNVVFSNGSVASGETATFQIVVKVNTGTLHGTVISNSATAMSSIPDQTPGNNSATTTTTVDPVPPVITCPANMTKNTDPNLCSAVVNYTTTATDNCPGVTVLCNPPSGSAFPKGTTTVNCTATDVVGNTASCSFTVTVNDTQPPVFPNGCPAGITKAAQATCPITTTLLVTYTTPVATDNCGPAPTVVCNPPSGGVFPPGTTVVTCTATDSSGNTAICTFPVNVFSFCLQDDSSAGIVVFVNAVTGDYLFCLNGVPIASGTGTLVLHGCNFQIDHTKGDRKVHIQGDTAANSGAGVGTAFISKATGPMIVQITDRKMTGDACTCSPPVSSPAPSK